jgi:DNA polymerase-3 subunit delta'
LVATENLLAKPSDWAQLIGYDHLIKTWAELLAGGNMPAVLLLTGRPGLGKRGLLAALAALHVCATKTACGHCSGCLWLLAGVHPEVLWLDGSVEVLRIDAAEQLQEHLQLNPGAGSSHRLVVIVAADQLNKHAANRLLKILEEPPARARILLSTSRAGAMLPTVLSRCVRWPVTPPALLLSRAWLAQRLAAAKLPVRTDAELDACLRQAGLSPGLAWAMLNTGQGDGRAEFNGLLSATSAVQVLEWSQQLVRASGLTTAQMLQEWEIAINQSYRQRLGLTQDAGHTEPAARLNPVQLAQRRTLLSQARKLVCGAQVPLNAQLLTEAIAFSERP